MSLVGFNKTQNHPQQVVRRGANDKVDDRETPLELFNELHGKYRFTVDAAANSRNTKLPRYYNIDTDGLAVPWVGERVWCNPPYSDCGAWVAKARSETLRGCELAVLLLPANRTEQKWWQEHVEPFRDRGQGLHVEFLAGRLRFDIPGGYNDPRGNRPPFGVCLLVFGAPA